MLVNRTQKAGRYSTDFNRGRLSGGVYYCTVVYENEEGRKVLTKPIIISGEK